MSISYQWLVYVFMPQPNQSQKTKESQVFSVRSLTHVAFFVKVTETLEYNDIWALQWNCKVDQAPNSDALILILIKYFP